MSALTDRLDRIELLSGHVGDGEPEEHLVAWVDCVADIHWLIAEFRAHDATLRRLASREAISGIALDLAHSNRAAIEREINMRISLARERLAEADREMTK